VRILWTLYPKNNRLFIQEALVLLFVHTQCFRECLLVRFGESERERTELFSRLSLRSSGEVLGHRLQLVEVTYLHGNILENSSQTPSAVNNSGSEYPPFLFKYFASIVIVSNTLTGYFIPPDVLLEVLGTEYTDTVLTPPEGRVYHNDSWLRSDICGHTDFMCVKVISYPDMTPCVLL